MNAVDVWCYTLADQSRNICDYPCYLHTSLCYYMLIIGIDCLANHCSAIVPMLFESEYMTYILYMETNYIATEVYIPLVEL